MSANGNKANEKKSNGEMEEIIFNVIVAVVVGAIAIFISTIAIPSLLLGYIIYWAWNEKPERQMPRTLLVIACWFLIAFYLAGSPVPTTSRTINQNFWQGALFTHYWQSTLEVYGWVYRNFLEFFNLDRREIFNHIRFLLYCPIAGGLIVAVAFAFAKFDRNTPSLYQSLRSGFVGILSPLWYAPERVAEAKGKLWGLAVLVIQNATILVGLIEVSKRVADVQYAGLLGLLILVIASLYTVYRLVLQLDAPWEMEVESPALAAMASSGLGSRVALNGKAISRREPPVLRDRIVIGKDGNHKEVSLTIPQLEHHVHVLGASGFGKTSFLSHLIGHHIRAGLGLIFVDLKSDSDTVGEVAARCWEAGRQSDLRLFDLSRPGVSLPYNPCKRGNATEIKDKIVGALDWESDYYKNKSQSFLLTVLRALVILRDKAKKCFTLEDLYQATLSPNSVIALEQELEKLEADVRLLEDLTELSRQMRSKEYLNELEGLRTQLKLLLDSEFGECLMDEACGIDFFEAIQNREIVYILLDSQSYGESAKRLGKLILQDLKSCSGEIIKSLSEEKRTHCTIVVDEFADLATEQFVGFLNRARGSKLGIVIAHQEVADLEALSPALRAQVMGNTSTTVSFLQKNTESAERVSKMAGTQTVVKQTRQMEEENFLIFKSHRPTGIVSEREVEEFRIHPNRIKELKRGQCVIVGKYPAPWNAIVAVNAPEKWISDPVAVENHLRNFKSDFTKRSCAVPLGLRRIRRDMEQVKPTQARSDDRNF